MKKNKKIASAVMAILMSVMSIVSCGKVENTASDDGLATTKPESMTDASDEDTSDVEDSAESADETGVDDSSSIAATDVTSASTTSGKATTTTKNTSSTASGKTTTTKKTTGGTTSGGGNGTTKSTTGKTTNPITVTNKSTTTNKPATTPQTTTNKPSTTSQTTTQATSSTTQPTNTTPKTTTPPDTDTQPVVTDPPIDEPDPQDDGLLDYDAVPSNIRAAVKANYKNWYEIGQNNYWGNTDYQKAKNICAFTNQDCQVNNCVSYALEMYSICQGAGMECYMAYNNECEWWGHVNVIVSIDGVCYFCEPQGGYICSWGDSMTDDNGNDVNFQNVAIDIYENKYNLSNRMGHDSPPEWDAENNGHRTYGDYIFYT